jgi:hypothetical protein
VIFFPLTASFCVLGGASGLKLFELDVFIGVGEALLEEL